MIEDTREILVFEAAGRHFGLGIDAVERVVSAVRPISLPQPSAAIEGIINLHGMAVPVLDLRKWFGDVSKDVELDDLFIVLHVGPRRAALCAERAHGVAKIAIADIQSTKSLIPSARYFSGIVMLADMVVFLPDLESFLTEMENGAFASAPPEATAA